ncbi:MAG: tandem-95 repeat protein, partial [Calditrichaeota bacterium]|nr:tandem-95 repeat protein [Calditrichota bacterium]
TWDTGFEDEGVYRPVFTVSDGDLEAEMMVTITIGDLNRAPEWVEIPERIEIQEGEIVQFGLFGIDRDNDQLMIAYLSDNLPENADFEDNGDGSGVFTWQTDFNNAGEYRGVFILSDDEFEVAALVEITVVNVNRAPSIADLNNGNQVDAAEDAVVSFALEATDPDGDALRFNWDLENLPQEAGFVDNGDGTADFTWDTGFEDEGVYRPVFTVSDDEFTAELEVTISISNVNRPPVITDPTDEQLYEVNVDEGNELEIEFAATDPDNNAISWAMQGQENLHDDWLFTNNEDGTATFEFSPMFEAAGVYELSFVASDPDGESAQLVVLITVSDVNRPPVVDQGIDNVTFDEDSGMFMVGDLDNIFIDPDEDRLIYSIEAEEPLITMLIEGENLLTIGSPADFNGDDLEVIITADDGRGGSIVEVFMVTVAAVNDAPFWIDVQEEVEEEAGVRVMMDIVAGDVDLEFEGDQLTLMLLEDDGTEDRGAVFTDNEDNSGTFTWRTTSGDVGEYILTFMVEDEAGDSETIDIAITVIAIGGKDLTVVFNAGWNMTSINIVPSQEMYRDGEDRGPDIILMTEHLRGDNQNHHLIIMKDGIGRFYMPAFRFNNIPYWNLAGGYQMKFDEEFETQWSGMPIAADADLSMNEGMNLISYYPEYELSASAPQFFVLSPILDIVVSAKDNEGFFMIPEFRFSNMPPWRETQGYKIKLTEDVVFNYPREEEEVLLAETDMEPNQKYPAPIPTGQNMSLLISGVQDVNATDNAQIVAIDEFGNVVGAAIFDSDGRSGIAIWGDDVTTDVKEGLLEYEEFELRLVDYEGGTESNLRVSSVASGNGLVYLPDGMTVLDLYVEESIPDEYYLNSNFPNPFNSTTKISFGILEDGIVNISVYNVSGRLIQTLMDDEMSAGHHQIAWEADGLPAGLYMLKIQAGSFTTQQKAILVK